MLTLGGDLSPPLWLSPTQKLNLILGPGHFLLNQSRGLEPIPVWLVTEQLVPPKESESKDHKR